MPMSTSGQSGKTSPLDHHKLLKNYLCIESIIDISEIINNFIIYLIIFDKISGQFSLEFADVSTMTLEAIRFPNFPSSEALNHL